MEEEEEEELVPLLLQLLVQLVLIMDNQLPFLVGLVVLLVKAHIHANHHPLEPSELLHLLGHILLALANP